MSNSTREPGTESVGSEPILAAMRDAHPLRQCDQVGIPLIFESAFAESFADLKNSEKSPGSAISIVDPSQNFDLGKPLGRGARECL